jgi:hypothetical protein
VGGAVGGAFDTGPGFAKRAVGALKAGQSGLFGGLASELAAKELKDAIPECVEVEPCD